MESVSFPAGTLAECWVPLEAQLPHLFISLCPERRSPHSEDWPWS